MERFKFQDYVVVGVLVTVVLAPSAWAAKKNIKDTEDESELVYDDGKYTGTIDAVDEDEGEADDDEREDTDKPYTYPRRDDDYYDYDRSYRYGSERSSRARGEPTYEQIDKAKIIIDEIVELGSRAWEFLKENRPQVSLKNQTASAVPKGVNEWDSLEQWKTPKTKLFHVVFKNGFRMKICDFTYRIVYTWGGTVDGKGKYLADVTVIPSKVETSMGFKVTGRVNIVGVTNAGTKKDPLAAMQLQVGITVASNVKRIDMNYRYYVKGDGMLIDLNNGETLLDAGDMPKKPKAVAMLVP